MSLPRLIRQQVRQRANSICEYCHSAEDLSASLFEIDHIHPQSLGGLDDLAYRREAPRSTASVSVGMKAE